MPLISHGFLCGLFHEAVSRSVYIVLNRRIIDDKLERICKEAVMPYLRYYPNIHLMELTKTMKNLSQ
jgi:hypothetical protein